MKTRVHVNLIDSKSAEIAYNLELHRAQEWAINVPHKTAAFHGDICSWLADFYSQQQAFDKARNARLMAISAYSDRAVLAQFQDEDSKKAQELNHTLALEYIKLFRLMKHIGMRKVDVNFIFQHSLALRELGPLANDSVSVVANALKNGYKLLEQNNNIHFLVRRRMLLNIELMDLVVEAHAKKALPRNSYNSFKDVTESLHF